MAADKRQNGFSRFLAGRKQYPVLAAVAAGLYPVLFYYSNNFTLINTLEHLVYFVLFFIAFPIVVFVILHRVSKWRRFAKWEKYVLPFLNMFVFLSLIIVCIYAGIQELFTLAAFFIAGGVAFFFYRYFKRIIVFQLLLAVVGMFALVPDLIAQFNYSELWMKQPDAIEAAVFQKRPNVYFIQPDGYVNFSELKKGYYNIDNSAFEDFLEESGFKAYPGFRSNYTSTLSSNSATFMMKHHYYNEGLTFNETLNAREIIISENPVLNIFKNNGYETYFLAEKPYLLLSKPDMGYDESNFEYSDISYLSTGLEIELEIMNSLQKYMEEDVKASKFFFIELFDPGHISSRKEDTQGIIIERELWKKRLAESNDKLRKVITYIRANDPQALIVFMADHGGYVGMEYTNQKQIKTQERDRINSMFSSVFAIRWPDGKAPVYDNAFVSSVNVFRILFCYLTGNEAYLSKLQDNSSYAIIYKEAPKGVYQLINNKGDITFTKHNFDF